MSFIMSEIPPVRPSVRFIDIYKILKLGLLLKSFEKTAVWLKLDKNNRHFC